MTDGLVRVKVRTSSFIKVKGSSFTATLQSLDGNGDGTERQIDAALSADFTDITPTVTLDQDNNYRQTLGGGNYALRFTAGTGEIVVTETS